MAQGTLYVPVGARPNPFLATSSMLLSEGNARYNALQTEVTRRLTRGLQFRANYTWSKNLDMGAGISASQAINQAQTVMTPYSPGRDYGPSALNVKHQASGSLSYELPIGEGKPWLSGVHGVAEKLIGGWQVNSIITLLSGFPFTPQVGSNRSGDGDTRNPDRPNLAPGASANPTSGTTAGCGGIIPAGQKLQTPSRWFDPCAFVVPTAGTFGNLGRGTATGPGMANVDLSLFKNTQFTERIGLQFRAEFFNIFNRSNFGTPTPIAFSGTNPSPTAGAINSTATTSRLYIRDQSAAHLLGLGGMKLYVLCDLNFHIATVHILVFASLVKLVLHIF